MSDFLDAHYSYWHKPRLININTRKSLTLKQIQ